MEEAAILHLMQSKAWEQSMKDSVDYKVPSHGEYI